MRGLDSPDTLQVSSASPCTRHRSTHPHQLCMKHKFHIYFAGKGSTLPARQPIRQVSQHFLSPPHPPPPVLGLAALIPDFETLLMAPGWTSAPLPLSSGAGAGARLESGSGAEWLHYHAPSLNLSPSRSLPLPLAPAWGMHTGWEQTPQGRRGQKRLLKHPPGEWGWMDNCLL